MQNNDAVWTVACCGFLYSGPFAVINIIKAENLPSLSLKNVTAEMLRFTGSIKKSDKKPWMREFPHEYNEYNKYN